jgi:ABC-type molybdate transport system substrate-binding protein
MKETFIIRTEWFDAISELPPTERLQVMDNLFLYHLGKESEIDTSNLSVKLVWKMIAPNLKRNIESYDRRKLTSAENGRLGGRPCKDQQISKSEEKPNNLIEKPKITKEPIESLSVSVSDSVSDSVSVYESVNDIVEQSSPLKKTTRTIFVKPAQDDIFAYMIEYTQSKNQTYAKQYLELESSKMFNYYESKGWTIGKAPMKDWKATTRNWLLNQNAKNNPQTSCAERPATKRTIYT